MTRLGRAWHGERSPVEGTDFVVWKLGFEREESRQELAALRARHPPLPIIVRAAAEDASRWLQSVAGASVVDPPLLRVQMVVEAVTAAVAAGQPSSL